MRHRACIAEMDSMRALRDAACELMPDRKVAGAGGTACSRSFL
jgi:hypothetical protein